MRFRALILGLCAALLSFSCAAGGGGGAVIKIGWLGALSGPNAAWGQSELNTLTMLVERQNAEGGLNLGGKTYRLLLVSYDDRGLSEEAEAAAKKLAWNDKVDAIIGPAFSREAIAAAKVAAWEKIPCIATTATNPKVTEAYGSVNPYTFRACFIDSYQGEVAATFAYQELGARTGAIFVKSDDAYSVGLGEFFNQHFRWQGGRILASVSIKADQKDFRAELAKVKAARPDVLFLPVFDTEIALAARQARDLGINAVLLGGDGWPSANLLGMAGSSLDGSFYVNHLDVEDPAVQDYRNAYRKRFGKEPELPGYLANDAVLMLLDALRRAQSPDGTAVAHALESCDIQGITGRIRIGKGSHNPEGKDAAIIKIQGGTMRFLERVASATP